MSAVPVAPEPAPERSKRGRGAIYVVLMSLAAAIGFAKTIALAGVLGAEELGYYGIVLIVMQYGIYLSTWGLLSALNVDLPHAYGRGDPDADVRAGRAFGGILLISITVGVLYLAVVLAIPSSNPDTQLALALAALTTLLATACEFGIMMMRVNRQLVRLSAVYMARALLALALTLTAAAIWGYVGAILADAFVLGLIAVFVIVRWAQAARPRWPDLEETRNLVRIGIPLTVTSVIGVTALTIDRVFVAGVLPDQLGQYTFASLIVIAWLAVSGMLSQAVTPELLHAHGAGASLAEIRRRTMRVTAWVVAGGVAGLGALLLVIPAFEAGAFSEYEAGLNAMPILYLGGLLGGLSIYGTLLLAMRRFYLGTAVAAVSAVVAVGGGIALAVGAPSLNDFAWLFTISQAVVGVGTILAAEISLHYATDR